MSVSSKREISTCLAKESKTSTQDVFCNVASERQYVQWCVVSSLFATKSKSSPFSDRLEDYLVFSASLYINRILQFALIQLFLVCQSLVSHLGNCVPAHCSRVASLLIKRALGSLISSCWWGRHLCHPTHSASSAVSESCKVKMSPTISLGISFLIIWPITSFPKGNSLISKLADWCNMSWCTGDGTGWSGWLNAFQL